ncbi:GTPase domain-containing protein [Chloroflexia bacterium SDU3-3]|nr:GTPase domain-containing protein [Chloroflexia bacterium SDU3-3]
MATIDTENKIIHHKIAYYGIGMAGKTSCFEHIHATLGPDHAQDLWSIGERVLFFQCQIPDMTPFQGCTRHFHLYTAPGSLLYPQTRIDTLKDADGVIFVASSEWESSGFHMRHNIELMHELEGALRQQGRSIRTIPFILQYHKRDLTNIFSIDRMNHYLNPLRLPVFETDLKQRSGGIMDAFDAITRMVVAQHEKTFGANR